MESLSVDQIGRWLEVIGFEKQIQKFKEENIDGYTLMNLNRDELSRLLLVINDDGTIKKPTIEIIRRFRKELLHWTAMYQQTKKKRNKVKMSTAVKTLKQLRTSQKLSLVIVQNISSCNSAGNVIYQYKYTINDRIHVQFFENPKFIPYLINYIQKESFPIQIDIRKISSTNEQVSYNYTIEFSGTPEQAKSICSVIEYLFRTVRTKIYHQNKVKTWLQNPKAVDVIQTIINNESDLFTVCQTSGNRSKVLEIFCFNNKTFNHLDNTMRIDQIIQKKIVRIVLALEFRENRQVREKKKKKFSQHTSQQVEENQTMKKIRFQEELNEIIKDLNQENEMVTVTLRKIIVKMANDKQQQQHIQIFGCFELVNDAMKKILHLLNTYILTKYPLDIVASTEIDYLKNVYRSELKAMEKEFRNDNLQICILQHAFYAPPSLKDEIESRIKILLSQLTTRTFKTMELYYDIAETVNPILKTIARNNRCHYDSKVEKIFKTTTIPRAIETSATVYPVSKSIIEQSDLFCSSHMVYRQISFTNGSLEVLIGDIATQKVDVIIIPSVSYGLKESLLERAGQIVTQRSVKDGKNLMPFITETTAGRLCCKKILFVNWSLSPITINDDENSLRESVRLFISNIIQYIVMGNQQFDMKTESIAFSVPDSCCNERILAEEMIYETQRQIQSIEFTSLKVSFILLPDKQTLHQEFLTVISTIQTNQNTFGILFYPTSTITITLTSSKQEYLTKCEEKINKYLRQSMGEVEFDGFNHWNQYLINAYFKFCNDRRVLPHVNDDQRIVLKGSFAGIYEAKQKYEKTIELIQEKKIAQQSLLERTHTMNFNATSDRCTHYNVMLSYCQKDSFVPPYLVDRLMDEGFLLCFSSNETIDKNDALTYIDKSDCMILCISENYCEDENCEKEVKYASQIGKKLIPLKIQNCAVVDWIQQLFEDDSYFYMFGSKNQFDHAFDKLLLEIFKYTIPHSFCELQHASNQVSISKQNYMEMQHKHITELSIPRSFAQIATIYGINMEQSIEIEARKLFENRKAIDIEKVDDLFNETRELFTEHADNTDNINAEDLYDEDAKDKTKQKISSEEEVEIPLNSDRIFQSDTEQQQLCDANLSTKNGWMYENFEPFQGLYHCYDTKPILNSFQYSYNQNIQYISFGISAKEQRRRQEMIDTSGMIKRRKEIGKYFINKYKNIREENLKLYLEFAQRMIDNANQLVRLCEMDEFSLQKQSKQQSQTSLQAIFSVCSRILERKTPMANSKIQNSYKLLRESNRNMEKYNNLHNRASVVKMLF